MLAECNVQINQQGRELTKHGTALFPIACYHDDLSEEAVPWHWHDELEAVVVTEGSAVIAAGSEQAAVSAGNGFFIHAGVLHEAWGAGDSACRFHSIVFHPALVGGSIDSVFWQHYLQPLMENTSLGIIFFDGSADWKVQAIRSIENAWQACVAEPPGYEFQARSELSWLIFLLFSHVRAPHVRLSGKALRDGERIKAMLQYIQEHHSEALNTAQIARSAMIGESECLRCFRSTIRTTPMQYVKRLRIQKAAALLASTDQKIIDIGTQCGFQEMSYFSKIFREIQGCTPSEYRKARRPHGQ